jgi:hypothetical protein
MINMQRNYWPVVILRLSMVKAPTNSSALSLKER